VEFAAERATTQDASSPRTRPAAEGSGTGLFDFLSQRLLPAVKGQRSRRLRPASRGPYGCPTTPRAAETTDGRAHSAPRRSMGAPIFSKGPTEERLPRPAAPDSPRLAAQCTEALVLSQPKLIEDIHRAYLTPARTSLKRILQRQSAALAEFALRDRVPEINTTRGRVARRVGRRVYPENPAQNRVSWPAASARRTSNCPSAWSMIRPTATSL